MSREIKFRVWVPRKRLGGFMNDHPNESLVFIKNGRVLPSSYPSAILMQFTGLKDKNGKEIWEGDILQRSPKSEKIMIEFKDGAFGYEYHGDFIKQTSSGCSGGMQLFISQFEVISNIHENPELLEGKRS